MIEEKYDFYSPTNLKIHDLNVSIKDHLIVMDSLDMFTKRHSENVANLVGRICQEMRCNNQFTIHCVLAGYLHDVGKLFIPKEIVNKPGKLTDQEYEIMKTHTTLGYQYCMEDLALRPYSDGPWYHHEALNGTGYPRGLRKSAIPYSAQIIRVADEYDAIVTKRQYTTHINISQTLKELIKDARPSEDVIALDQLKQNERLGKINPKPLKALFKVVIDDTLYEISCVLNYVNYIKEQIKRLKNAQRYEEKMITAKKGSTKDYYKAGMQLLFQPGENFDNYKQVLAEYENALVIREDRIAKLYDEIKVIKRLKI